MRRNKVWTLALALALLLTGCTAAIAPRPQYLNPIDLYYCRQEASFHSETGALDFETVELERSNITIEQILARYFEGPSGPSLRSPFPEGLACTRTELDDGVLTLYLNEAYGTLSGVELSLASACLTLTLTQIEFVDSVRLQTPGARLPAQTDEALTPEQFVLFDDSAYNQEQTVTVYFCGRADGLLRSEARTVSYSSKEQLPSLAVEALLAGPDEYGNRSWIPQHTQLIDLSISDGVCTLVLSEAFSDCDSNAETARRAVRQLAATVCAFDAIDSVRISLLDGSSLNSMDLSASYAPEQSWFAAE